MEIAKIQELVKKQAAATGSIYPENGNTALHEQAVKEPVIPLPTTGKNITKENVQTTSPAPSPALMPSPQELRQFIKKNFIENRDFMRIPAVPKPILTKEGSIKILGFMHLRPQVKLLDSVYDAATGTAAYTYEVTLITTDGMPIISGVGASSTAEKKYAKAGLDAINTVCNMAYKRALIAAVKQLF